MMELQILKDWLQAKREENRLKSWEHLTANNYHLEHYYSVVVDKIVELQNRYLCMSLREAGYDEPA